MPEKPINVSHDLRLSELDARWERERQAVADATATVKQGMLGALSR